MRVASTAAAPTSPRYEPRAGLLGWRGRAPPSWLCPVRAPLMLLFLDREARGIQVRARQCQKGPRPRWLASRAQSMKRPEKTVAVDLPNHAATVARGHSLVSPGRHGAAKQRSGFMRPLLVAAGRPVRTAGRERGEGGASRRCFGAMRPGASSLLTELPGLVCVRWPELAVNERAQGTAPRRLPTVKGAQPTARSTSPAARSPQPAARSALRAALSPGHLPLTSRAHRTRGLAGVGAGEARPKE